MDYLVICRGCEICVPSVGEVTFYKLCISCERWSHSILGVPLACLAACSLQQRAGDRSSCRPVGDI